MPETGAFVVPSRDWIESEEFRNLEDASLEAVDIGGLLDRVPHTKTVAFLSAIGSKIRDKGRLSLSVADFDRICEDYKAGTGDPEIVLCGPDGLNAAIFNRQKLCDILNLTGFEILGGADGSLGWKNEPTRLAVTASRRTRPRVDIPLKGVHAIMSLPRVSWTETFSLILETCCSLQIPFTKSTGVFWDQGLQRMMSDLVAAGKTKYILTFDYDSIFEVRDVVRLHQIMESNPDIDVLCPIQIGRDRDEVLLSVLDKNGKPRNQVDSDELFADAIDIGHGHFGMTLIRTDALRAVPKPWLWGQPNKEGDWTEGRMDPDIYFWKKLREHGRRVCATPKVRLGHLQLVVSWPTDDLALRHQYVNRYMDEGRPRECMTY